jgi:Bacterial membrane protein YfhO
VLPRGDGRGLGMTGSRPRRHLPRDVLGIAWVIIAGWAVIAPALFHGLSLGPYDLLSLFGLSQQHPSPPHNGQMSDLIAQMIPWTTLAWNQVHHGLLPIWNPYTGLGAPLAFNWQSATFSIPALAGYLVPLRMDFTVQVLTTLAIAGTGMYFLGRVLRLGVLGAAMAATAFELGGAFTAVLGWPIASVMSWSGWLFAGSILVMRGNHRRRDICLFAVVVSLAVYAGQPDTLVVLIVSLAAFVVVTLGLRIRRLGPLAIGRPLVDLTIGTVAGLGLAAPLILPASELSSASIRGGARHAAQPVHYLLNVMFQSFNGLPLKGASSASNLGLEYVPTAVYVGGIAIVLAFVAIATARRRSAVLALAVVLVVAACLVYFSPLVSLLEKLPGVGEVRWVRAVQIVGFALAILAGVGLDALARSRGSRSVRNTLGVGFGAVACLLLVVWLFGRGHLSAVDAHIRAQSFIWPAIEVAVGVAVFVFLVVKDRRSSNGPTRTNRLLGDPSRLAAVILLVTSTVSLVTLGESWWPSSASYPAPSAAEATLQKAVGTSIVGFGTFGCYYQDSVGILPEANAIFDIHELDTYDPLTPRALFDSWMKATRTPPRPTGAYSDLITRSKFCPVVRSVAAARLFGVGFVLELHGVKGPPGSVFDKKVGDEELYRIPGVSVATVSPLGSHGLLPPADAAGKPLNVTYPKPGSWNVVVNAVSPQVLRLRLTDVPGWHASIDGRPLRLVRFNRVMLQAVIPGGRHTVELHYWPEAFSAGIVVAVLSVIGLVALVVFGGGLRRRLSK